MAQCVLPLLSKPNLHGTLNGLTIKGRQLVLDEKMFPCCAGSGEIYDAATNTTSRCGLTQRLTQLQYLIAAGHKVREKGPDLVLQKPLQNDLLGELLAISQHHIQKGRVFINVAEKISLWDYALAAVWRFGLAAYYVHPGKSSVAVVLDHIRQLDPQKRTILFIEPVSKLWDAMALQDFATLVDFSYNAMIPCWVRFADEAIPAAGVRGPRTKYAERMTSYKQRAAMEWLPEACKNRLQAMCIGWEK